MTLNWKPRFKSLRSIWDVMLSKPTWLLGAMVLGGTVAILKEVSRDSWSLRFGKRYR